MTDLTPNDLSPQGVPNNPARCPGSGSYEDEKWYWREGCNDCYRRITWYGDGWIEPPPIIAFECEYRIGPDKIVPQGEHAPGPKPLSTAAQALLDAVFDHWPGGYNHPGKPLCVAAAIRALADQVTPSDAVEPRNNIPMAMECQRIRSEILAIAAELVEGHG